MNLAESELLLQIQRHNGMVEKYGSLQVNLVPSPSDPLP